MDQAGSSDIKLDTPPLSAMRPDSAGADALSLDGDQLSSAARQAVQALDFNPGTIVSNNSLVPSAITFRRHQRPSRKMDDEGSGSSSESSCRGDVPTEQMVVGGRSRANKDEESDRHSGGDGGRRASSRISSTGGRDVTVGTGATNGTRSGVRGLMAGKDGVEVDRSRKRSTGPLLGPSTISAGGSSGRKESFSGTRHRSPTRSPYEHEQLSRSLNEEASLLAMVRDAEIGRAHV